MFVLVLSVVVKWKSEFPYFSSAKTNKMEPGSKFTICRLCLYKSESLIDIFEVNVRYGYVAAEVITDLLQFQVTRTDVYPRVVCSRCLDKLTDFKVFKEQCKASRATYDNLFIPNETFPEVQYIPNPMGLRTVKIEPIEIADDEISSQMSCRSENMDSDDVIINEVSTTQTNLKPESSRREESVTVDSASTQASFSSSNMDYSGKQVPIETTFSPDSMEMKEVSTQVSFNVDPNGSDVPGQGKKKRDETPEQREKRLLRQRTYYSQRKQTETSEKREIRLSKMRELATRRRENETEEQRQERLSQLRMYAVKRIAHETEEQREIRLRNMRIYAENRLANETLEQRQRRLGHAPFNTPDIKRPTERRERGRGGGYGSRGGIGSRGGGGYGSRGGVGSRGAYSMRGNYVTRGGFTSRERVGRGMMHRTVERETVDDTQQQHQQPQHELFGDSRLTLPQDRVYEPQGQFYEYLSQLGLGLVEQRVNQVQEQYGGFGQTPGAPNQEKYVNFNAPPPQTPKPPSGDKYPPTTFSGVTRQEDSLKDKYLGCFNQLRPGIVEPTLKHTQEKYAVPFDQLRPVVPDQMLNQMHFNQLRPMIPDNVSKGPGSHFDQLRPGLPDPNTHPAPPPPLPPKHPSLFDQLRPTGVSDNIPKHPGHFDPMRPEHSGNQSQDHLGQQPSGVDRNTVPTQVQQPPPSKKITDMKMYEIL